MGVTNFKNPLFFLTEPGCEMIHNITDVFTVVPQSRTAYAAGETITYECPDGYHLVGSAMRTCQTDLTWSGQQPECIEGDCSYQRILT